MNTSKKAPDKFLEAAGKHDHSPFHYAAGPSRPDSINVAQINCEQSKEPKNQQSRLIPIHTVQDGGNLDLTREPRPRKGPDKSFEAKLMHDHGPLHSMVGLNTLQSHHEWKLQSRNGCVLLRSANLRHCYETYSAMTKDLPRENL